MIWGWGAGADRLRPASLPTLALFGFGLLFFTVHYLTLRGFYALERNRTVFWIQCVVAVVNIAVAVVLVREHQRRGHLAGAGARLHRGVRRGLAVSYLVLRRSLGGLGTRSCCGSWSGWRSPPRSRPRWRRRGPAAGLHAATASPHWPPRAVLAGGDRDRGRLVFVVLARLLRIREVTDVLDMVTRRLPSARASTQASYDDGRRDRRSRPDARRATPGGGRHPVPHSIRPGDVLAGRYLLVDLLSESGDGRFWRAHDRILDRHVSVHVIGAERRPGRRADGGRPPLGHGARPADPAGAGRRPRDGICYVVNEWGSGTSLDILVANEGPLGPRRVGLDRRPRWPPRSRPPTRPASRTAGWCRRTS